MGLLVCLAVCLAPTAAQARPLTSFDLSVVGLELDVAPGTQQVPKGVTSTVTTQLTTPHASIPLTLLHVNGVRYLFYSSFSRNLFFFRRPALGEGPDLTLWGQYLRLLD